MTICVMLVGYTLNSQANDGNGTANDVAMWSDSNTLGDAPIAISGNNATFAGNITVSSDMRLKDNIQSLGQTMVNILKLDAKSYTRDGRSEIGLIAQDVQLVYPELVSEDANEMLSVNYQGLVPVLINAIKEQEDKIIDQQTQIDELKELVNQLID